MKNTTIIINYNYKYRNCRTRVSKQLVIYSKFLCVILFLFSGFSYGQTATAPTTGDGSSGNPYQIATLDNLYWLSQQESNSDATGPYWSRNFKQTADIDASSSSGWSSGSGWSPIGNSSIKFTGSYNGNGN